MRPTRLASIAILALLLAAVIVPAVSHGHPERVSTFPDLDLGHVPRVRHTGKAIYVCKADSAARIRFQFSGRQERHRLRQLKLCRFRNIQAAVNHARSGYRIRILPGVYKERPSRRTPVGSFGSGPCANDYVETEGFTNTAPPPSGPRSNDPPVRPDRNFQLNCPNSKNLIEVTGDTRPEPDPTNPTTPKCLQLCNLQIEGLGSEPKKVKIVGDRKKLDVLRIDRANGIVIRNLLVEQSAFNGIDLVEVDGFRVVDVIARYNQDYGVLSFTSERGLYNRVEAYRNGDSGVYPGSNQKGCVPAGGYPTRGDGTCGSNPGSISQCGPTTTEIRNSNSHHNVLGYSGTAGNSVYMHDNRFHHNSAGISTDSFASGHPGMPQECVHWTDNAVYSNNNNFFTAANQQFCQATPFEDRKRRHVCPQFQVPVGVGILLGGANRNLVDSNQIYDNWRYGILLFAVPAGLRGDNDPAHQQDTSNGNRVMDNLMGVGPGGPNPNGVDIEWDESGQGNCFEGNSGPGGAAVSSAPGSLPACPGSAVWAPPNPAVSGPLVPCAAWDPANAQMPPGCDWFVTPPEP